jgi:hypothetical protein
MCQGLAVSGADGAKRALRERLAAVLAVVAAVVLAAPG